MVKGLYTSVRHHLHKETSRLFSCCRVAKIFGMGSRMSGRLLSAHPQAWRIFASATVVATILILGGCAGVLSSDARNSSSSANASGRVSMQDAAAIGDRWENDRGNVDLAIDYAERLNALGQQRRAIEVLGTSARLNPADGRILAAYGKALAAAGELDQASLVLKKALDADDTDWTVYSAQGSVLDKLGQHEHARRHYDKALERTSNRAAVQNNIGMSHALEGNLELAEQRLTRALEEPGETDRAQIRQNLALVIGLQGRFDEARAIASQDLPPNLVEANMSYIRSMMEEKDPWKQLSALDAGQS